MDPILIHNSLGHFLPHEPLQIPLVGLRDLGDKLSVMFAKGELSDQRRLRL